MRQKGFVLFPAIFIIVFLGVVGYFVYQNTKLKIDNVNSLPQPKNLTTILPKPSTTPDLTANWLTYSKDGFRIKYPGAWSLYTSDWEVSGTKFGLQKDDSFVLWLSNPITPSNTSLTDYVLVSFKKPVNLNGKTIGKYATDYLYSPGYEKTINSEEYSVGGKVSLKVRTSDFPNIIYIFTPFSNSVYTIVFAPHANEAFMQSSQQIFSQILSTLKFTQ